MAFRAISRQDLEFSVDEPNNRFVCVLPNWPFNALKMEPILTAAFQSCPKPISDTDPRVEINVVGNGVFLLSYGKFGKDKLTIDNCIHWVDNVVTAVNGSINGPVPPEVTHIRTELERIGVEMTRPEVPGIGFLVVGLQAIFWKTSDQRGYVLPTQMVFEFLRRYEERELSVDEMAKFLKGVCMNFPPPPGAQQGTGDDQTSEGTTEQTRDIGVKGDNGHPGERPALRLITDV